MRRTTLEVFRRDFVAPQKFAVAYHDPGHLQRGTYVRLAIFDLDMKLGSDEDNRNAAFAVTPASLEHIKTDLGAQLQADYEQGVRDIRKYLADTFLRTGLLNPQLEYCDLAMLVNSRQLVVLVDTNILNLGILDFILDCRESGRPVLAIVPVTSVLELQKYSDQVRPQRLSKLNSDKLQSLRGRSMGITAVHHIQQLKERCLVEFVEVDPATLQFFYVEVAGQQRGGTKADRIIIESIKQVISARRFSEPPKVLTGDKNVAKFLRVENVEALYVGQPQLPDTLYSVTYNLFAQTYYAANVHYVLWALAEAFGDIRIDDISSGKPNEGVLFIRYPYDDWSLGDWLQRRLDVQMEVHVS